MRVAVDVTPLHDRRTGIGTVTSEVLDRLARRTDIEVVAYSVSWRGRGRIRDLVPEGVEVSTRPMAAQPLRQLWRRTDLAPVEWWTGPVDAVLGTNFVVPPTRSAGRLAVVYDLTPWRFPELCTRDTLQYPGLVARAVAGGAHLLTISATMADELVAVVGARPDRVHWAHLAPSPPPAGGAGDADRGRGLAGADRYVLGLGTVEPRKGFPTLVRAVDRLDDDVTLVIAGQDGWGSAELDAAVAAARPDTRVVRLGYVDDRARSDLLAGAAAFVYPSRYEGFGIPPLEAMAAGVPVVASTAGALPEVLGDAALLVAPDDDAALAAAVTRVVTDTALAADLVARGRTRAAAYSWDRTADAVVTALRATAAGARRPGSPPTSRP